MYKFRVNLTDVRGYKITVELATESEQDAKIITAHCCNVSVKKITNIECIGETNEAYFKTISTESN